MTRPSTQQLFSLPHIWCPRKSIALLFLVIACLSSALAQEKNLGPLNDFKDQLKISDPKAKISAEQTIATSDGSIASILNIHETRNNSEVILGEVKGKKGSNVSFTITNGNLEGLTVIPSSRKAYRYYSRQGNVFVREENIDAVLCVNYAEPANAVPSDGPVFAVPPGTSPVYKLQSLPGVTAVAYLDFDGQYVSGTRWNGGNPINAQPGNFTETDITNIWKMISEDYRPFNINITTDSTIFRAAPVNRRMRCIFTPTNTAAPGSGGVAYVNSFSWNDDTPCWVFNSGVKAGGEAGSHELGHTLGLSHDGRTSPQEAYYAGQGIWAPIMGVGYSKSLTQWSKGEYANANNTEDDIAIIAGTRNGFGFRADDAGNTNSAAKALSVSTTGAVAASANYGIITQRTDVDVYAFTTSGGACTLTVNPSPSYPDLDVLLTLTNSAGTVVAAANPTTTLSASISASLAAGTYYLQVDGTGQGDPLTTGYTDYASLGEYSISGSIAVSGTNQAPAVSITAPANGSVYTAPATVGITANASDQDGTISRVEFYNEAVKIGESASAPYAFTWSNVAAGNYSITAIAYDNAGAFTTSAAISITVNSGNQIPLVSITAPASNALYTAPANVSIAATASDPDGTIVKVEFYNGAAKLGESTVSPYTFSWTSVAAGTYTLTAKAYDNAGAVATSAPVTITVQQSGTCQTPSGLFADNITSSAARLRWNAQPGATSYQVWWRPAGGSWTYRNVSTNYTTISNLTRSRTYEFTVRAYCGGRYTSYASPYYRFTTLSAIPIAAIPIEEETDPAVTVAPHPFNNETSLTINNGEKIMSVKVFDLTGQQLFSEENINKETFSLGNKLEPGVYIIRVNTDQAAYMKNIVKTE